MAIGTNKEVPQFPPVISKSFPVSQTPKIPGRAPAVFDIPSKAAAYFGDKSWWLQYKPPLLKVERAKATERVTINKVLYEMAMGLRKPHKIMQAAGPRKATP